MLGGLRVFLEGEELRALPSKPQRAALLAYLAVVGESTRDRICLLLWPESSPKDGRHALSQTQLVLRQELGGGWVDVVGETLSITRNLRTDLQALEAALDEGRHDDALELYRGPFLDGTRLGGGVDFERWIDSKRGQIHRKARACYRAVTASAVDPGARVEVARTWVERDPLDDEAQHALIEALAVSGDRVAALSQFKGYEELLAEALELTPLDATKELVDRIRAGDSVASAPAGHFPTPERSVTDTGPRVAATGSEPPTVRDRVRIVREIGDGATGTVYLAREPGLTRMVAVKVLSAELSEVAKARARFAREAQSAARILHPHVVTVHWDGVTQDDRPYFVMPYVKGVTLSDRLKQTGPVDPVEAHRILAETISALAAAHAVGVVHRDVRPANVIYEDESGRTYLTDFGIAGVLEDAGEEVARLTYTGELLGNPDYISPEQMRGEPLDGRSDVYSWGVMGREILFGTPTPEARASAPEPEDLRRLTELLERATAERSTHRPTAKELEELLSRRPEPPPAKKSLWENLKARRLLPFVGAYLAAGVAGMGGVDQLVQQDLLAPIAYRLALALFVAGLNAAIIVAWFHGEKGQQPVSRTEAFLLSVVVVAWMVANVLLLR